MRQIVLDTETTGLEVTQGHRIIEIGALELLERQPTGQQFHFYLNPEREVEAGAMEVHGISNDFLKDKPLFTDIVSEFMDFIDGAELIIHNASFDLGFLDYELSLLDQGYGKVKDNCSILDTLLMAREMRPGQRNSLDALCKFYDIDNTSRTLHGALLDAQILTDVYLAMTGGQTDLGLSIAGQDTEDHHIDIIPAAERGEVTVIRASAAELALHKQRLEDIEKASDGKCVWSHL
ncbi:MAG: DNA polymerase III subunit epsilon [Proteobacteria bacterium]|nr:DNA polymerase III subunit epsilon [Pseudomonadota bacterium]